MRLLEIDPNQPTSEAPDTPVALPTIPSHLRAPILRNHFSEIVNLRFYHMPNIDLGWCAHSDEVGSTPPEVIRARQTQAGLIRCRTERERMVRWACFARSFFNDSILT
jgi:hypothetical protein